MGATNGSYATTESVMDEQQQQKQAGGGDDYDNVSDGGLLGDTSLLDIAELFLSPPRGSASSSVNLNNINMFAGSAKTGEGVRPAFEWLIRMATFLVKAQKRSSIR